MEDLQVRKLDEDETPQVEAYLARYPAKTMFLRSNLRQAGMATPPTRRFEGTYVGVFRDDELVGVVGHFWNGILLVQADAGLERAARLAVETASMKIGGVIGDLEQVEELAAAFGLPRPARDATEHLYELPLEDLAVPEFLEHDDVVCRKPTANEFDLLVRWRVDYLAETMNDTNSAPEEGVRREIESGTARLLVVEGVPVSHTAFNAQIPGVVQIGGVWTPPDLRGRGYARAVVAAHLAEARCEGVERAILFTGHDNVAAQRAYEAIGFRRVGEYGLLILDEPVTLPSEKKDSRRVN